MHAWFVRSDETAAGASCTHDERSSEPRADNATYMSAAVAFKRSTQ
jgi:hypothetical protein